MTLTQEQSQQHQPTQIQLDGNVASFASTHVHVQQSAGSAEHVSGINPSATSPMRIDLASMNFQDKPVPTSSTSEINPNAPHPQTRTSASSSSAQPTSSGRANPNTAHRIRARAKRAAGKGEKGEGNESWDEEAEDKLQEQDPWAKRVWRGKITL